MRTNTFKNKNSERFNFLESEIKTNNKQIDNNKFLEKNKKSDSNFRNDKHDKQKSNSFFKEPNISFNSEDFPTLSGFSNNQVISEKTMNFKDVVKTQIKEEEIDKVKPGWVEYRKVAGKTIITYGNNPNFTETETENENCNIIMNNAINKIVDNYFNYRHQYDEKNGYGAYDSVYYLSPVYGSDYEKESLEDASCTDEDDY